MSFTLKYIHPHFILSSVEETWNIFHVSSKAVRLDKHIVWFNLLSVQTHITMLSHDQFLRILRGG